MKLNLKLKRYKLYIIPYRDVLSPIKVFGVTYRSILISVETKIENKIIRELFWYRMHIVSYQLGIDIVSDT